jgi:phenylalanyl-tRNA synthetase beta chain
MSSIRPSIIPSLIQAIRESQKSGLPLRIFEIGYYGYIDTKSKGLSTGEKLALALVDYRVGYEDIQSSLEGLLSILGITPVYQRYYSDIFIKGRSSIVKYNDTVIGYVGEIYPQILVDNQIKHPVGVAEVYLDILYQLWKTY